MSATRLRSTGPTRPRSTSAAAHDGSASPCGRHRIVTLLFALPAALALALPVAAGAQPFPTKPIRLIVPFPPGGSTDIVARLIAEDFGKNLGQPIVVENRGGGAGLVGAMELVKAAPDGYTLGVATVSTMAVNPACNPTLPYRSPEDFSPITNLAAVPNVMAVSPGRVSAKNMADFIKYLKANPRKLSFASSGTCSVNHMMGELFKLTSGTSISHIPYRGSGPALNDVLAGQVEILFDNLPSSLMHIRSGKLRALAVAAPKRVDLLPNVPTFAELGMAPVNHQVWYGLLAPAKTPDEIIKKLHAAALKALGSPRVREGLQQQGATPVGNTPAQFREQIVVERDKMIKLVKQQGIKIEQ